jgi:hypothetical protein
MPQELKNPTKLTVQLPEVMGLKLNEAAKVNGVTRTALVIQALVKDYGPTVDEYVKFHMAAGKTRKEAEAMWESL